MISADFRPPQSQTSTTPGSTAIKTQPFKYLVSLAICLLTAAAVLHNSDAWTTSKALGALAALAITGVLQGLVVRRVRLWVAILLSLIAMWMWGFSYLLAVGETARITTTSLLNMVSILAIIALVAIVPGSHKDNREE
ncbi:hypothetical protein [Corynebacterium glucuronolyticum]|uniref:hypothetical protein n=1 Tax=Corynebacterium glucuronolyticum TaxID=39791 RepID=UPI00223AAD71|nr:hypothetical protein [Corynebacterium glucuronolyticum]MCT1443238.1 hypothetical protein [Corynebacterium glucuronolyticum]